MSSIEFLQSLGWISIIAYCLNALGFVPPSWVSATQTRLGLEQAQVSPTASPMATPKPSPTAEADGTTQPTP